MRLWHISDGECLRTFIHSDYGKFYPETRHLTLLLKIVVNDAGLTLLERRVLSPCRAMQCYLPHVPL